MGRKFTKKMLFAGCTIFCVLCLILAPLFSKSAHSFSAGAPAGVCGAPGDAFVNCTMCHAGPSPFFLSDAITSDIPPTGYVPGNTYNVSAKIRRQGHVRFGFEISPQDSLGNQIGSMGDVGPETTFTGFGKYITHSSIGTFDSDSAIWYFQWTAPPAGTGNFTFWGAFNATNNDGAYVDDTIFISELYVIENTITSLGNAENPFSSLIIFPNGFNQVEISFQLPNANDLTISLYDLEGKNLYTLFKGFPEAEYFNENLDLPGNLSGGIYFLNFNSGNYRYARKIFLPKTNF